MKKQNDLQWFLIKKFIEILAVVGVVEYLLTFLVNRFVLPNVLLYFFPGVEENPLLLGSGVVVFLSAVLMLLILGALNAMFPSTLHEMVQAALEQMQKNFMHTVSAGKTNFSFYELNRGQAILLFLVAFVVVLVILTPYVSGAVCFAKITIKEFRQIQREREEEQTEFDRKRNLMLSDIAHDLRTPMTTVNGYAKALADIHLIQLFLTGHRHISCRHTSFISCNEILQLADFLLLTTVSRFQLCFLHRINFLEMIIIAHITVQFLIFHMINNIHDFI